MEVGYFSLLRDQKQETSSDSLLGADGKSKTDRHPNADVFPEKKPNLVYNRMGVTRRMEWRKIRWETFGLCHLSLRLTSIGDIKPMVRDFYPQFKKQGLVIDGRQQPWWKYRPLSLRN